jgi:hypothetical protein
MAATGRSAVVGVFDDIRAAEAAIRDLERAGFGEDRIGFLLRDRDLPQGGMSVGETGTKAEERELAGAAAGIGVGGLLGAAAALLLPGIGPVAAGGILAAGLTGAGVGAAAGGIIGLLTGMGVPEEEARYYEGRLRDDQSLVIVRDADRSTDAASILRQHGALDVERPPVR